MFCDIVGSTPLAETLDPEDFREILDRLPGGVRAGHRTLPRLHRALRGRRHRRLLRLPPRARGQRPVRGARRPGDAGGARRAQRAACATSTGISLRVRIGIHTGHRRRRARWGSERRGSGWRSWARRRTSPPAWSRSPPRRRCVISDDTRDLVEGYFVTESLGAQQLKGVSRPIDVHRVLRATGAVGRLEVAGERRLTPLVGRDHELARLAQAWQQVKRGHGAIVHLTGEAGIGKSRIVRELLDRLNPQIGRGADLALLAPPPRHHALSGHPLPGAAARARRRRSRRRAAARARRAPCDAAGVQPPRRCRSSPTCSASRRATSEAVPGPDPARRPHRDPAHPRSAPHRQSGPASAPARGRGPALGRSDDRRAPAPRRRRAGPRPGAVPAHLPTRVRAAVDRTPARCSSSSSGR